MKNFKNLIYASSGALILTLSLNDAILHAQSYSVTSDKSSDFQRVSTERTGYSNIGGYYEENNKVKPQLCMFSEEEIKAAVSEILKFIDLKEKEEINECRMSYEYHTGELKRLENIDYEEAISFGDFLENIGEKKKYHEDKKTESFQNLLEAIETRNQAVRKVCNLLDSEKERPKSELKMVDIVPSAYQMKDAIMKKIAEVEQYWQFIKEAGINVCLSEDAIKESGELFFIPSNPYWNNSKDIVNVKAEISDLFHPDHLLEAEAIQKIKIAWEQFNQFRVNQIKKIKDIVENPPEELELQESKTITSLVI